MTQPLTVHDVGELGLLQRLFKFCPGEVVGDDAAVLALPPDQQLVVTTDVLVDGVHFSDRTTAPEDTGWRAVAANLSDLAAMGAEPRGITVGLSLPGTTPVAWVERLYQGMDDCLTAFGGDIVGGDLCRSDRITLAITALGFVSPNRAFYRRSAQPGQAIVVTGYHGLSRAGLECLLHPEAAPLPDSVRQRWIQAHRRPRPRFDAVEALWHLVEDPVVSPFWAAMDTSDGLANALVQICQASGVGARLPASQLPLDPDLVSWVGQEKATDWTLYGGEDFELMLTLPLPLAQAWVQQMGEDAAIIGEVTANSGVIFERADGGATQLDLAQGFQHF